MFYLTATGKLTYSKHEGTRLLVYSGATLQNFTPAGKSDNDDVRQSLAYLVEVTTLQFLAAHDVKDDGQDEAANLRLPHHGNLQERSGQVAEQALVIT